MWPTGTRKIELDRMRRNEIDLWRPTFMMRLVLWMVVSLVSLQISASAAVALARFVKDQFGMELTFCILVPMAGTTRKPRVQSPSRARCA